MRIRPPFTLALAVLTAAVLPLVMVGLAGAGTNVWTDEFPHPTRWKGYKVTCGARGCSHLNPVLTVDKDGLRYRTATRVIRAHGGYGLDLQVRVSVIDGQRHGVLQSLTLSGHMQSLTKGAGGWGFGGGSGLTSHVPQLRPGQHRLLKTVYPGPVYKKSVRRGERFTLTVSMTQVVHYNPHRSSSPSVAVLVLTVPFRGKPTLVFKRPKP